MRKEKSCGAVIVNDGKVLLELQTNGFWSFPKGHVELNESEIETAKRETKEETGLEINIDEKKRFVFYYEIPELNIKKEAVLFLATTENTEGMKKQDVEISALEWVPIEKVENYFSRDPWKKVWREILPSIN